MEVDAAVAEAEAVAGMVESAYVDVVAPVATSVTEARLEESAVAVKANGTAMLRRASLTDGSPASIDRSTIRTSEVHFPYAVRRTLRCRAASFRFSAQ